MEKEKTLRGGQARSDQKIRGYSVRVPPTGLHNPEVGNLFLVGLDHLFSLDELGEESGYLL